MEDMFFKFRQVQLVDILSKWQVAVRRSSEFSACFVIRDSVATRRK